MTVSRTVVYRIKADVSGARTQVAAFSASLKKAADEATAATKEGQKFRAGLDTIGGAAGKVGLAAAAGLGAAVLKAANFDAAMSQVQAATRESAASMETLRKAALDAGASTVFSATEAADGIEQLAKAGVATADILNGGLLGALDLAAAGTIDVASAAEIAATTMNQFGLEGDQVTHIADVLAAAAGKAQGEVTDMANALKFVGPVAAQMGVSLEETSGAIAYLASQGILGEQAGTSLRGMLTGLTSPSKIAADEMKALGINMYDASGQFIGLDGLAGQLKGTMSGLGEAERDAALGRLFGNEQITAARILYKGGTGAIEEWTAAVDDQGFAADTAATKLDNLKGDLEALSGAFETALIGTGEGSQGPLRALTQGLTDAVNAYNDLGSGAKSGVAVTLGATAALGGGLFVFSKMVTSVAATRVAMQQLGVTTASTAKILTRGGVLLALAGVAYGIREISKATDESLPGMEALTGQLLSLADAGNASSLGKEFDSLGDSINHLNEESNGILGDGIESAFDGITGSTREAKAEIEALDAALANIANTQGIEAAEAAWQALAEAQGLNVGQQMEFIASAPLYKEAIAGIQNDNKAAATATEDLVEVTDNLGNVSYKTAEQIKVQEEALQDARDAAWETASSFYSLSDGIEDVAATSETAGKKATLSGWIKEMADAADAAKNFRENLKASRKNGVDKGLLADLALMGPEGEKQLKWLAGATKEQIEAANKEWRSLQRELKKTADAIDGIPAPKPIKPVVLAGAAMADLYRLREFKIGDKTIKVHTVRVSGGETEYLSGRGWADGGYTGAGGKYEPAGVVHRGEYVFDAKATKGNEAYLASLHSTLRGYSGGGMVGGGGSSAIAPAIDYERLAGAMSRARPLYGDVNISGDPSEFKRQMQRDKQAANMGGRP